MWVNIGCTLFCGLITGISGIILRRETKIRKMEKEQEKKDIEKMILSAMKPYAEKFEQIDKNFSALRDSYRFKLIELCQDCLDQGYLTSEQYFTLGELWKAYSGIGGNGQGEEYYHKATKLQVLQDDKKEKKAMV